VVYFICYGNEGVSWSLGDVGRYVTIRKLLDSIFNSLPVFIRTYTTGHFFCRAAFTLCDVLSLVEQMDFNVGSLFR
jgi:hypothetical protein